MAQERPSIHLIGIDVAGGEREITTLQKISETWGGDVWPLVVAQPFTEDRAALFRQIASAHVALMPSWHEGFGLTGWEAIAAGVPLIVSEESGLYRLIKELAPGHESCLLPVTVGGHVAGEGEQNFTEQDVEKITVAVTTVAGDWQEARVRARILKELLDRKNITWEATAGELLTSLGVNAPPPPSVASSADVPKATSTVLVDRRTPLDERRDVPESLLLRPENLVVPFHSALESLCVDILSWTLDDAAFPQRIALRLYAAEGGSGKTRLLIETCSRLLDRPEQDWIAGFVADRQTQRLAREISALVNGNPRVFIVIDYAEMRRPDVRAVVSAALRGPANHRVRIILLGRGEGDWWDLLRQEERRDQDLRHFLTSLHGTQGPFPMPHLKADDLDARRKIFENARQAFALHLGKRTDTSPIPNLGAAPFGQILFLHLGALASLHGRSLEEEGALLDATLDRERDYWVRGLASEGLGEDLLEGLAQSVAVLTLIDGVQTAREAKEVLAVTPRLRAEPQSTRDKLFDMLRRLYPLEGGIDALRPDLLGERHVSTCVARDEELLEEVLDAGRHPGWTHSALTVLTRLAKHGEDRWLRRALRESSLTIPLVEKALQVAVEVGDPLGLVLADVMQTAGRRYLGIVNHVSGRLPEESVALSELAAVVLAKRRDFLKEKARHGNKKSMEELIRCSGNLSNALSGNGRPEDALRITDETCGCAVW